MSEQKGTGSKLKTIAVDSLEAGTAFSEAIYIDDDNVLVPARIPILQKDLDKIMALGIETVVTVGEPVDPNGGELEDGVPKINMA